MKTNRINAPFSYANLGQAKPVKESCHETPPRMIRVYHCIECRQPGGTLQNIGTHEKPIYIHLACRSERERNNKLTRLWRGSVR